MELELSGFKKTELLRVCELVGIKNKDGNLGKEYDHNLITMIAEKVNPNQIDLRDQYLAALDLFKIKYRKNISDQDLKEKLYNHSKKQINKAIKKLSKKKKQKLTKQLEESLDPEVIDQLKKAGGSGLAAGGSILLLQGGAIAITGSNLGICMLLTTGLSSISGILGVTFPFAAYMVAGTIGGFVIQAGHFLVSPFTAIPMLGIAAYLIYRKIHNQQYINLAGVNYLIESKKRLGI